MLFQDVADWYPLIDDVCEKCGVPELGSKIRAEFSTMRMTCCLGVAYPDRKLIRLSRPLWPYATETDRAWVIAHEACHVVDAYRNGPTPPHGKPWKALMRKAGFKPDRCHKVPTKFAEQEAQRKRAARQAGAFASPRKRHARSEVGKCACGPHPLTKNTATRMRNGSFYSCRKCDQLIVLEEIPASTFS